MVRHICDTTGVVIASSDVAGSTALPRLEFLFSGLCVCGSDPKRRWHTGRPYSRDGLNMVWYALVLTTIQYNTIRYDAMRCDAMRCDAIRRDAECLK